mmetsp:Transcript_9046/g.18279  ORF Transcript_9046/g.18279 Transcript_9046/m.18279 type:complete len:125 (+) Transcript_9046:759-1133(+)
MTTLSPPRRSFSVSLSIPFVTILSPLRLSFLTPRPRPSVTAHTAGGRMIGKMMSTILFDGKTLRFYQWPRDVKEILNDVRVKIDRVAKEWSRQVKDDCLEETSLAFAYSGTILGNLAKAPTSKV